MTLLRNPTPGYPVSSRYGPRKSFPVSPGVWTLPFHYGDDHTAPGGTPIVSVLPGKVIRVGYDNNPDYEGQGIPRWPGLRKGVLYGGGYWIFIQTGNLVVRYMHMARPTHLKVGDSVEEGQQIGVVGTTGVSTGNHLHIETLVNGKWVDPMLVNADHYKPNPKPKPRNWEEEDEMKPTVHVRTEGSVEYTRAHPEIGKNLKPGASRKEGKVTVYRGWEATADTSIGTAWARTHAGGSGHEHSRTDRAGYIAIQEQATRLSVHMFG